MLTQRQQDILQLIMVLYSKYSEPVGSKKLLNESQLQVSPATIRNEMAELEKLGYVDKAHRSSGRKPTHHGIKLYLTDLSGQEEWHYQSKDINSLNKLFANRMENLFEMAKMSADVLHRLTHYPVILYSQTESQERVKDFKLTFLDEYSLIASLITTNRDVESQLISLKFPVKESSIDELSIQLNEEFSQQLLVDVYKRLEFTIPLMIQQIIGYQIDFSPLIQKILSKTKSREYYIVGKNDLLSLITLDFKAETLKEVLDWLDGSTEMLRYLESLGEGIHLKFGHDMSSNKQTNIHLLTVNSRFQNNSLTLGVLGPDTMSYYRVLSLIHLIFDKLKI